MKKTDRRVIRTQESICKAFSQLIQNKEYHSITITELADLANIDRKTFYLHYNSIDDILRKFEDELAKKISQLLEKNQPFEIDSFFQGMNELLMEDIGLYRRMSETTPYAFLRVRCKDIFKEAITKSFYDGSGLSLEEFDVYAEYISSGIMCIYTNWLMNDSNMSLEELTNIAKKAVLNGWNQIIK